MEVHSLSIRGSCILEVTVWIWCELTSCWSENIISRILCLLISSSTVNTRIPPLKSNCNIIVIIMNSIFNRENNLTIALSKIDKSNFKLIRLNTFIKTQRLIWLNDITVSNVAYIKHIDVKSCCHMINIQITVVYVFSILKCLLITGS